MYDTRKRRNVSQQTDKHWKTMTRTMPRRVGDQKRSAISQNTVGDNHKHNQHWGVNISVKSWRIDMKGIKRVIQWFLYPLVRADGSVLVLVLPSSEERDVSLIPWHSIAVPFFLQIHQQSSHVIPFHKFWFLSLPHGLHELLLLVALFVG